MSEHLSTLRKYVAELCAGLARALGDLREPRRSNGLTSVWTVFSSGLKRSSCTIVVGWSGQEVQEQLLLCGVSTLAVMSMNERRGRLMLVIGTGYDVAVYAT